MDQIAYTNDLLVRFEEIFYHELSQINARCKVELIGTDFLENNKNIKGKTVEEIVDKCVEEIKKSGLVKGLTGKVAGKGVLLKLNVTGCVHLPKEARLKADGIEPYMCPISNMIMGQIIEKLNYLTSYTARLEVDNTKGQCELFCAVYENMEKIGQVSDWTKV
jgi:hypothetical protein